MTRSLGRSAMLQMETVEEATLAFEDWNFETPDGYASPISIRYLLGTAPDAELPVGVILLGHVKTWSAERMYGFISIVGYNYDVAVGETSLADAQTLSPGAAVLFRAEYHTSGSYYAEDRSVIASSET